MLIGLAASTADGLDSPVDERFGRCGYFVIVNPDTMEFTTIENGGASATKGACQQAADLIVSNGVEVVMAGNVGNGPMQKLYVAGVEVITGVSGSVRDAVMMYKEGRSPNEYVFPERRGSETRNDAISPREYYAEVSVINEQMDLLEEELRDKQRRLQEKK